MISGKWSVVNKEQPLSNSVWRWARTFFGLLILRWQKGMAIAVPEPQESSEVQVEVPKAPLGYCPSVFCLAALLKATHCADDR